MEQNTLIIDSSRGIRILKALGTEVRVRILELLQNRELNISDIAKKLEIPQSTAATSVLLLEKAGLIDSHNANGVKGGQKICKARYKELLVSFNSNDIHNSNNSIEVEMPVGLFTSYNGNL